MIIQGKLAKYNVEYVPYAGFYAVIHVKAMKRQWYGLKRWKTVRIIDDDIRLETFDKMYPGEMLVLFTEAVKDYENYLIAWRSFEAIQQNGVKLEINDE